MPRTYVVPPSVSAHERLVVEKSWSILRSGRQRRVRGGFFLGMKLRVVEPALDTVTTAASGDASQDARPSQSRHRDVSADDRSREDECLDFDQAFRRYAKYVATIAYRLSGSDADTEEITQDVFLRLSQKWHLVESEQHLRRWLSMVTVRAAGRHKHRFRFWALVRGPVTPDDDLSFSNARSSDETQLVKDLYRHLHRLPTQERIVWVLHYVEGHDLTDIADLCGVSRSTAKRRLAAARAKLERVFDGSI